MILGTPPRTKKSRSVRQGLRRAWPRSETFGQRAEFIFGMAWIAQFVREKAIDIGGPVWYNTFGCANVCTHGFCSDI
jgi:hypothetical protein